MADKWNIIESKPSKWGAIYVTPSKVTITCTAEFKAKMRVLCEKKLRKSWVNIKDAELVPLDWYVLSMLTSRMLKQDRRFPVCVDPRAGLLIGATQCRRVEVRESIAKTLIHEQSLTYERHSDGWVQHSYAEVAPIQEAWREHDKATIALACAECLLKGRQAFAEHLARVLAGYTNKAYAGLQPIDVFDFFIRDERLSCHTAWGEAVDLCNLPRIPDGPIQWRKVKTMHRKHAIVSLSKTF